MKPGSDLHVMMLQVPLKSIKLELRSNSVVDSSPSSEQETIFRELFVMRSKVALNLIQVLPLSSSSTHSKIFKVYFIKVGCMV